MKKIKILAVAAALSAVMTGSAFAAFTPGQTLTIDAVIKKSEVVAPQVTSKTITITGDDLDVNQTLATITGLPAGAMLVDTNSTTAGEIKFTRSEGVETFQAKAYVQGHPDTVVSAGSEGAGSSKSGLANGDVVDVVNAEKVTSVEPGTYHASAVVYTWAD
ncbi:TPA: hypothetical protein ACGIM3_002544 [Salmonella enterica subsp. enterica serovar Java]